MNPLNWFKRKPQERSELEQAMLHGLTTAETGRQTSEIEHERQLAENALLIKDPRLEGLLMGMSKISFIDNDNTLGQGIGAAHEFCFPKYVALRILSSSLIRTSFLDPLDAEMALIENRCIQRHIKMSMTEEDYESGGGLIVDAVGQIINANIVSAKNGRMAKLVKVTARSMEVAVAGGGKNQRPGVMQQ